MKFQSSFQKFDRPDYATIDKISRQIYKILDSKGYIKTNLGKKKPFLHISKVSNEVIYEYDDVAITWHKLEIQNSGNDSFHVEIDEIRSNGKKYPITSIIGDPRKILGDATRIRQAAKALKISEQTTPSKTAQSASVRIQPGVKVQIENGRENDRFKIKFQTPSILGGKTSFVIYRIVGRLMGGQYISAIIDRPAGKGPVTLLYYFGGEDSLSNAKADAKRQKIMESFETNDIAESEEVAQIELEIQRLLKKKKLAQDADKSQNESYSFIPETTYFYTNKAKTKGLQSSGGLTEQRSSWMSFTQSEVNRIVSNGGKPHGASKQSGIFVKTDNF